MAANLRDTVHALADQMPEDATIEDAIERLSFMRAVDEGKRAAASEEFATEDQVRSVFAKYGVKA
jgi:hypothetical protein